MVELPVSLHAYKCKHTHISLSLPSTQVLILRAQDSIERTRRVLDEFDERFYAFLAVQEKLDAE